MKLIVFSGFLGSGKTVAILSLAAEILREQDGVGTRLAILENEVGEAGIDGSILEHAGMEVRTLLSGCICCTLSTDLTTSVRDIQQRYNPEYLIFEPTGVAYPDRIIRAVEQYTQGIHWIRQVAVVDAKRWNRIKRATPGLVRGQVAGADFVLLNKCDLITDAQADLVEKELREINAAAGFYRTTATEGVSQEIWKRVIGDE